MIGALIALGIFYLLSDMSRVKSLTVTGNHVYSDEVVLEKANLNYDSSFILTSSWWVEHTLKNDVLIKNVDVAKASSGVPALAHERAPLTVPGTGPTGDTERLINRLVFPGNGVHRAVVFGLALVGTANATIWIKLHL